MRALSFVSLSLTKQVAQNLQLGVVELTQNIVHCYAGILA